MSLSRKIRRSNMKAESLGKSDSWWEGFNAERTARLESMDDQAKAHAELEYQHRLDLMIKLGSIQPESYPPGFRPGPDFWKVDPEILDYIKFRTIWTNIWMAVRRDEDFVPVFHLWFPNNDIRHYEKREGNPPADSQRPKHLKRLQLQVDIGKINPSTAEHFRLMDKKRAQAEQFDENLESRIIADPTMTQIMNVIGSKK